MQYRLTLPMMVLAFKDNHQAAVTIPAGTLLDVVGPVEDDDRFLLIMTNDGPFHIFASDLIARAKPVGARWAKRAVPEESSVSKGKRGAHRRAVA